MGAVPFALAIAIVVCVPLALRAAGIAGSSARLLLVAHPVGALAAIVAMLVSQGALAAAVATGWLLFTLLVALHGLTRVLAPAGRRIAELCVSAGFMYLAVGGGWFVLWRSGLPIAGFGEHIPLLTAIHFHLAGFASAVLAGLVGRQVRPTDGAARAYGIGAVFVIAGPALVALGIAGVTALEYPAAVLFAVGTAVVASLAIPVALPRLASPVARWLLAVSSIAAVAAMSLAVLYAGGNWLGLSLITVEDMARWHGWANAIGYVLCGLVAWNISGRSAEAP